VSNRFFYDGPLGPEQVALEGPEAHHLAAVRRFAIGDAVTLFNGNGREYPAKIVELAKKRVLLLVTGVEAPSRELGFALHIAAALPKGDRGDFLIEKLTELGVTDFTPLVTERGIVKPGDTKAEKLRRAVIEASKQCGRNVLMRIHPPAKWLDWCSQQIGRRLMAHPSETFPASSPGLSDVIVAIGPEGGFSDVELKAGVKSGWLFVNLGPRILRVETAAIAAAVRFGTSN
jgi:16S rRNA (uracil1498-N3)-methyltransferase